MLVTGSTEPVTNFYCFIVNELEKALLELERKKKPVVPIRQLQSGKEAYVWLVEANKTNELFALKVYRDLEMRSFRTQRHYLEDRYVGAQDKIRRAIKTGNKIGRAFIQHTWVMREHYFLKKLASQTEYLPKLIVPLENGALLEYFGTQEQAAPRLSDVSLPKSLHQQLIELLLLQIELYLANGIVHGDFSAFNILWWKEKPIVIDFPQAIDVRESKRVPTLLKRDIRNMFSYFRIRDESMVEQIANELLESYSLPTMEYTLL